MKNKTPLLIFFALLVSGCVKEIYLPSAKEASSDYAIFSVLNQDDDYISVHLSPFNALYKPVSFDVRNVPQVDIYLYEQKPGGNESIIASNFRLDTFNSGKENGFVFDAPLGYLNPRGTYWIKIIFDDGSVIHSEKQTFPTKIAIKNVRYSEEDHYYRIQFEDPVGEDNYYSIKAEIKYVNNNIPEFEKQIKNFLFEVTDDTRFDGNDNAELSIEMYHNNEEEKIIEGAISSLSKTGYHFFNKLIELYWQTEQIYGPYDDPPITDPFSQLFRFPLSDLKSNLFNQNNERVVGAFLLTQTSYAENIAYQ